jgi:hypothetical protein
MPLFAPVISAIVITKLRCELLDESKIACALDEKKGLSCKSVVQKMQRWISSRV